MGLSTRLWLGWLLAVAAAAGAAAICVALEQTAMTTALASLAAGATVAFAGVAATQRGLADALRAVEDTADRLGDGDASSRVALERGDEIGSLLGATNRLVDNWADERANLRERELVLEAVLEASPVAALLVDHHGRVVYTSRATRTLLAPLGRLEGNALTDIAASCPVPLAAALLDPDHGGIVTLLGQGEQGEDIVHLRRRRLTLHGTPATLILLERITAEVRRSELALWKRTTRLLCHELANSLAPIASLSRSARLLALAGRTADAAAALGVVEERAEHLDHFLADYGALARLPAPRREPVVWSALLAEIARLVPLQVLGRPPERPCQLDPGQFEQVLINLTKNGLEAGSPEVTIEVRELAGKGVLVEVADRGAGFTTEALREALLPFWSTKADGNGLGLALVREVVEAHGGRLALANRPDGGAVVSMLLPTGP